MGKFHTFLSHLFKDADCIWDTGFEDIIGVDQKRTGIWIHSGIGLKCSVFIRETHDPAVCVCAKYGNVEHLACKYIGGAGTSADHSGACTINTGIRSLCTTKTKFHDSISSRCVADAGCLGSNKTLMIDDVQDRSLNKLCFHDRCNDLNKRFSWKYDSSLRDCINITGKMKAAQIFQKIFFKNMKTSEVIDVFRAEMKIFDILDHLFQTCSNCETASARVDTIKHIKDNGLVGWVLEITLHHC